MKNTTQTTAERQAALRARRALAGLTEVRGMYLAKADHAKIKKYAVALLKNPS